jgi:hypothetical protein
LKCQLCKGNRYYEQLAERAEQERLRAEAAEQRAQQLQKQSARQQDEIEPLKAQLRVMQVSQEDERGMR